MLVLVIFYFNVHYSFILMKVALVLSMLPFSVCERQSLSYIIQTALCSVAAISTNNNICTTTAGKNKLITNEVNSLYFQSLCLLTPKQQHDCKLLAFLCCYNSPLTAIMAQFTVSIMASSSAFHSSPSRPN